MFETVVTWLGGRRHPERCRRRLCPECHGDGLCPSCHGKGGSNTRLGWFACVNCGGAGECPDCAGQGEV